MKVEILHIEECSNWERAGTVIEEVLSDLGATDVSPKFVLIRTPEEAEAVPFAGSPTILIDGVDPFPGGFRTTDLACRIYRDGQRMAGVPSRESLRQVLADALAG